MRTKWVSLSAILMLGMVLGLVVAPRMQTNRSSKAPNVGPHLRPGTYRATWTVPGPDPDSRDNQKAGRNKMVSASGTVRQNDPLPRVKSTFLLYGARSSICFDLSLSNPKGAAYDVLRLDANRNGDLRDDKPVRGRVISAKDDPFVHTVFTSAAKVPLNTLLHGSSNGRIVALDVYVHQFEHSASAMDVDVRLRGCWAGTVDSDSGPVPFRILDYNMNGLYSDTWKLLDKKQSGGDLVVFDWSGKGDFRERFSDYPKHRTMPGPAEIFGELVSLKCSTSGDQLTIARYTGPAGRIAVKPGTIGNSRVVVSPYVRTTELTGHSQVYTLPTDGTQFTVPAGEYVVSDVDVIPAGMEKAPGWMLRYFRRELLRVEDGKTTPVEVEGTLCLAADPKEDTIIRKRGDATAVRIALLLSDHGLVTLDHDEGSLERGTSFMLPSIQMRDAHGKVVYEGRVDWYRYNRVLADYGTIPKTLKPGKYAYEIAFDTGPFGGVLKERKTVIVK